MVLDREANLRLAWRGAPGANSQPQLAEPPPCFARNHHDRDSGLHVHDIHPFLVDEIVRREAARSGLTWHFNRPPVVELEYEMDCRGVVERIES